MKTNRAPDPRADRSTAKPQPPAANSPASFPAAEFPELRSFLRGYFHQDMKDEYGSPEEAAREFCSDASGEERAAVAQQWSRFLAHTHGQPIEALNRILTGPLGSAHALTTEEIAKLSAILSPPGKKSKKA